MKPVMRFAIKVHFKDEANPCWVYRDEGIRSHLIGTTSNYRCADTFAYPGNNDDVQACATLLKEAESHWGAIAEVNMELVDMTDVYAKKLAQARKQVQLLEEMLKE